MHFFKKFLVFFIILLVTGISIAEEPLTISSPELTEIIVNKGDSGIEFTAVDFVSLTGFVFQNQGSADTIFLKNSNGDVLETYHSPEDDISHQANVDWTLTPGQTYTLVSHNPSNGVMGDFSTFPLRNFNIRINGSYDSGNLNTNKWFSFKNITTTYIGRGESATDTDDDGIPDEVEIIEGTNPAIKDNDIFGDSRLFVMQMYRDFLNREGDDGGIEYWVNKLDTGTLTRIDIIQSFLNSHEFSNIVAPIIRLYRASYSREPFSPFPDYDGLLGNAALLRAGLPLAEISEQFEVSYTFTEQYGSMSNLEFVLSVYSNALGRVAESAEVQYWLDKLDGNEISRGRMLMGFSESSEFKAKNLNSTEVAMMYLGLLKRRPESGGFNYWKENLDNGVPNQDLIRGFFYSQEYHNLFLPAN